MRIAGTSGRKLAKRVGFTVASLKDATCPTGKDRTWLYDRRLPGLAMMVTAAGSKAFYLYRKVKGRPQRVRLGAFPDISIDQARDLARKSTADIANGIDPMAQKREARVKGMNVGELFTWFLEKHAKPRKRSWRDDESRYDNHLKTWAARRLTDLTRADVAALHQRVAADTSGTTANRVLALLSTMFNKARAIGWEKPNPCQGVEKFPEQSRERFLSAEELKRFFEALDNEPDQNWLDLFKLALFTGARKNNILTMRWAELDLDAGRWLIPAAKFKNGKASTVYLPAPALEILARRKGGKSEWVFPSYGTLGHLRRPNRAWTLLCERAKLENLHIHDLRRTLGSWQAAAGTSLHVIGKSLGHSSQQATAVYARLQLDPVRQSVDAATGAMLATVEDKSGVANG
jgi:integrase